MKAIVLASGSLTRAEILSAAGVTFSVSPSAVDEGLFKAQGRAVGSSPAEIADALARAKARAVAARCVGVVIGADQTLEFRAELFDKTCSLAETRNLLRDLRGQTFHLHSAVALAEAGEVLWNAAFLDRYIERNADRLIDSLGGFELEGEGAQLFEAIDGDYFAVLGLPLLPLLDALRIAGALET